MCITPVPLKNTKEILIRTSGNILHVSMKKLLFVIFISIVFLCSPIVSLHAEEIPLFNVRATIQKDGSFLIDEDIVYDFGDVEKHGMYRFIPFEKTNADGKRFRMNFDSFSVVDSNQQPHTFTRSTEGIYQKLKIGDAQSLVNGRHVYSIQYNVRGGLSYFSDHDELYWQVTGTEWEVPIRTVSFTATFPSDWAPEDVNVSCFVGTKESTASACLAIYKEGEVRVSSNTVLSPGEGLTVVIGFPKDIVAVLEPTPVNTWFSDMIATLASTLFVLGTIFWYLVLPIWIVVRWFQVGKDPKPPMGVTSAWFDVPKTDAKRPLTPGETGTLIDEKAEMREITATIIDMARRGYVKIIEKKKGDFYLEKRNSSKKSDTLEQFEKTLYDGIFSKGESVRIKDADLISAVSKTKKELYEAVVKEKFFVSNPDTVRTKYSVIGGIAFFTMNFPLAVSAFIFGRNMPRKTLSGSQGATIAQSLKNFIVSQTRQYKYQAKNQIFFEKFLPYAIVFGVEKIWAERFKDIRLTKPDWYDGDLRTWNSVFFVNSLTSSMHSVASAATPTSSSSGFSSGFSGGSVGGGGGGGGGGSW